MSRIINRPKRRYHKDTRAEYSPDGSDNGPHCRCGLRLFGDEEIPDQCNNCLPANASGMLGRRGEAAAVTWTPRAFRG